MPSISELYTMLCLSSLQNCAKNSFLDHLGTPKAQAFPHNPSLAGVQTFACIHWKEAHLARQFSISGHLISLTQCLPNFLPLSWVWSLQPYRWGWLILWLAFCPSNNWSLFQLPAMLFSSRPSSQDSSRRKDSKVTRISGGSRTQSQNQHGDLFLFHSAIF